jgi:cobalt/nickel transport protein
MRHLGKALIVALLLFMAISAAPSLAHFGALVPSDDIVSAKDPKTLRLRVAFMHPFEGHYMDMQKPGAFAVTAGGKRQDLLETLKRKPLEGKTAWEARYRVTRPGDYVFAVSPRPYWEPAERKFIVHYTKVVVNALGLEEGWDTEAGLPVEIVPLARPYGLWAGNVFRGLVKKGGKPLPFAEVEVEFLNEGGEVRAPDDPFVTQVVKAGPGGVFTYAMPRGGWWAFSALTEADYTLRHEGREYPVELGGVIWIRAREMR